MSIKQWVIGDCVSDALVAVARAERKTAGNGSAYWDLLLRDRTGDLSGKIWSPHSEGHESFDLDVPYVVKNATVDAWNGNKQLKIVLIAPLGREPSMEELGELVPVCDEPVESIMAELDGMAESITDQGLRTFTAKFLKEPVIRKGYMSLPAGTAMHHAYVGGLAKHVRDVAKRCVDACAMKPDTLDRDILVAGAIMHDVGKIDELAAGLTFSYTDAGNFIGHIPLGVARLTNMLKKSDVSREYKLHLLHMVVSHHGKLEWGSPKLPATPEAWILAEMDVIDARMDNIGSLMSGDTASGSYNRAFERHMYLLRPEK